MCKIGQYLEVALQSYENRYLPLTTATSTNSFNSERFYSVFLCYKDCGKCFSGFDIRRKITTHEIYQEPVTYHDEPRCHHCAKKLLKYINMEDCNFCKA